MKPTAPVHLLQRTPTAYALRCAASIGASLVLAVIGAGCSRKSATNDNSPSSAIVQRVKPLEVSTTEWSGSVRTSQAASLAFSVPGRVSAIRAEIGDRVTAGTVILELEGEPFALQLKQAEAEVQAAAPALAEAQRRKESEERLWSAKATSQAEYEAALSAYAAAAARAESAAANLALAHRAVRESKLVAPVDGRIARRHVTAGTFVDAGTPVVEFDSDGPIDVVLQVPAARLADLQIGQSVSIQSQLTSAKPLITPGSITHISQRSVAGGSHEVLIRLPADAAVLPGEPVSALIPSKGRSSDMRVPATAVQFKSGGIAEVWIVTSESDASVVQRRTVVVGAPIGADLSVTSGLRPGELIIATGGAFLRDGQFVRPILRE